MALADFFKGTASRNPVPRTDGTNESVQTCPKCSHSMQVSDINENYNVCINCGHHFRMNIQQRLNLICDEDSFEELFTGMKSHDILDFPGYKQKLKNAKLASGEKEAVTCGTAKINGHECAVFIMNPYFMMGSMGTVVGEKITLLFEYATEKSLPVVGFTVSGGARMQEGILSLMQMAKTSVAVKEHSDAGNLYIAVLTDPTTGGVTASFAMEADIILAEPFATVGFAGRRVIEQTIRNKLPDEFQKSEFLESHGFVDKIVPRRTQKETISQLLAFHDREV